MGSSNQARPLGRAAFFSFVFMFFLFFLHADRASWINIYLLFMLIVFQMRYKCIISLFRVVLQRKKQELGVQSKSMKGEGG